MRARFQISPILLALASAGAIGAQTPNRPQAQQPSATRETSHDFLNQLNSCDSACSEQIARAVNPHPNAQQRQSLPNVAEKSKLDAPWQTLLAEALAIQSQTCELPPGKVQNANAGKDEKERTRRLADAAARANAHVKTIVDPYVAEFMRMQINRIWNASCPNNVAHIPSRRDPEDTDTQKDESATNDPPDDNR